MENCELNRDCMRPGQLTQIDRLSKAAAAQPRATTFARGIAGKDGQLQAPINDILSL